MKFPRGLALLAGLLIACVGAGVAQEGSDPEPKDPKSSGSEPGQVYRGFLPQNWGQLGLTDEQRQEIYKRQTKYRDQIKELEKKIDELKQQERKELYEVLTNEQKDRLKAIILEKIGGLEPGKE